MPHAITSGSKRKGTKVKRQGGLGGPGGRGGRRWAIRELEVEVGKQLPAHVLQLNARDLATAVRDAAEHEEARRFTTYRRAMAMLTAYADRESKKMKPEMRKKLADAKRELRDMYGQPQTSYGKGGPGTERHKAKAKSRRTSRK
jgi:hypothetical protein